MTPTFFPKNPHEHAAVIADAVANSWHRAHGSGAIEVPLSVVAAWSFLSPSDDEREWTTATLLATRADKLADLIRAQWALFITCRPDLVNRAWPLISVWHSGNPPSSEFLASAKEVSDAAIRAGLLSLTGTERRRETDLFGPLLVLLRPDSARDARGQIYTPGDLSDVISALLFLDTAGAILPPEEGHTVLEPAAGTGGMLRSAAAAMRAHGDDPAKVRWYAVDIDEIAIACLAVNVVLWELGFNVVLGVGNALTDDWLERAEGERRETVQIARDAATVRALLRMTNQESKS